MNCVQILGRLTKDNEIKYSASNVPFLRNTIAVNRRYTTKDGERISDFIPFVAINKSAEIIEKYSSKGQQILLEGSMQSGSYTKEDGTKVYTLEMHVERVELVGAKQEDKKTEDNKVESKTDPYKEFSDEIELSDDDLPF